MGKAVSPSWMPVQKAMPSDPHVLGPVSVGHLGGPQVAEDAERLGPGPGGEQSAGRSPPGRAARPGDIRPAVLLRAVAPRLAPGRRQAGDDRRPGCSSASWAMHDGRADPVEVAAGPVDRASARAACPATSSSPTRNPPGGPRGHPAGSPGRDGRPRAGRARSPGPARTRRRRPTRSTSPVSATLPSSARSYSCVSRLFLDRSVHPSEVPTKPADPLSQGAEHARASACVPARRTASARPCALPARRCSPRRGWRGEERAAA